MMSGLQGRLLNNSDIEKMNMYDIKAAHIKEDKQRIIEIEGKFSGIDTLKDLLKM